ADAAPVAGGDAGAVDSLVTQAMAATGLGESHLFGEARTIDFSLFKPRGHYDTYAAMQQYFRATMWLGHIDMPLIKHVASGQVTFNRRAFGAALILASLVEPDATAAQ